MKPRGWSNAPTAIGRRRPLTAVVGVFAHVLVSEITAEYRRGRHAIADLDLDVDAAFMGWKIDRRREHAIFRRCARVQFRAPQMSDQGAFFFRVQLENPAA